MFQIRRFSALCMMGLLFILALTTLPVSNSTNAQAACPPAVGLQLGVTGQVLAGLPNAVRNLPGTTAPSTVIGQIAGGAYFTVVGGPTCVDGYNWWQVVADGVSGWTADGNFNERWVSPVFCPGGMFSRIRPNIQARVTPGLPNVIRSSAGGGSQIGSIPAGGVFTVLTDAPACDGVGRMWWRVNYNGIIGWTAEGESGVYWVERVGDTVIVTPTPTVPPPTGCTLASRLRIGTTGLVTPGDPNVLRSAPGTGTTVVGQLLQGAIFTVLEGPVCANGIYWWRVTAGGLTGWTAEGQNNVYWLDPLVCANGLVSRVAPGMRARVAPGLPQRIRTAPSTDYGVVIGSVPAGGVILILNNFQCDTQGRLWWQVYYFGRIGWTAEGDGGIYWIEPT